MKKVLGVLLTALLTLTSCSLDEDGEYWLVRTEVDEGWSVRNTYQQDEFEWIKELPCYEQGELVTLDLPNYQILTTKLPRTVYIDGKIYLYNAILDEEL